MKIKKGDTVIITIGKDKGKKGKVDQVFPRLGTVLVHELNMFKRHQKKRDQKAGGIVEAPRPMDLGKVALVCPSCHKPTRVGYVTSKGDKVRVCRKCEAKI